MDPSSSCFSSSLNFSVARTVRNTQSNLVEASIPHPTRTESASFAALSPSQSGAGGEWRRGGSAFPCLSCCESTKCRARRRMSGDCSTQMARFSATGGQTCRWAWVPAVEVFSYYFTHTRLCQEAKAQHQFPSDSHFSRLYLAVVGHTSGKTHRTDGHLHGKSNRVLAEIGYTTKGPYTAASSILC